MPDEYWKIDRYARLTSVCPESDARWDLFDDSHDMLTMMLSDVHQLVISQGSMILESHSLVSARAWMRGVCRNDSLLFICRAQMSGKTETRKFRVRFCEVNGVLGADRCKSCVEKLQQFIPVKLSVAKHPAAQAADTEQRQQKNDATTTDKVSKHQSLEGEVTLGDVAQALLSKENLPMAYSHHHTSQESLQQMLRVCLADPAFPAFVQSVENELKTIASERE